MGKEAGGRGTTKSMGGKFRRQLISLMKVLDTCSPQYIRCIKPNHEKRGNKFVNQMCLDQLKFSGVFEAVEIRKTGYPFRYTQQAFANRFRSLTLECNSSFLPEDMVAKGLSLKSILSTKPITDYRGICEEILFSPDKFAGKHLSSQGENSNIQLGNHRDGTKQCAHQNNFSLFFNIAHSAYSFKYLNANCRLSSRSSSD